MFTENQTYKKRYGQGSGSPRCWAGGVGPGHHHANQKLPAGVAWCLDHAKSCLLVLGSQSPEGLSAVRPQDGGAPRCHHGGCIPNLHPFGFPTLFLPLSEDASAWPPLAFHLPPLTSADSPAVQLSRAPSELPGQAAPGDAPVTYMSVSRTLQLSWALPRRDQELSSRVQATMPLGEGHAKTELGQPGPAPQSRLSRQEADGFVPQTTPLPVTRSHTAGLQSYETSRVGNSTGP